MRKDDSNTIGGYLRPTRLWVLPLREAAAGEISLDLDEVFHDLAPRERVAIRSIASPIDPWARQRGWGAVEALRAGHGSGGRSLPRRLGRNLGEGLRDVLSFALAGQSYQPRSPRVTRERLAEAGAAEAKLRGSLVVLEVHVLVRASDRRRARARLRVVAAVFDRWAGPFNWLEVRRPWRRRTYIRSVEAARGWRGAGFIASAAEAAALTGRPVGDLTGLTERRIWTRHKARRGRVSHDAPLFLGHEPDG